MRCMLCGRPLAALFRTRDYRRDYDPTIYTVGWCSRCRYGRVGGALDPESVARFYKVPYYTHHPISPASAPRTLAAKAKAHLAWKADRGSELTPEEGVGNTLLDVGCGSGTNLSRFSSRGFSVTGVEPDEPARQVASAHGLVHAGTAEMLPQEVLAGSYNTVLLSHVLEHCIEPRAALLNAKKVLAPGGRLIIEVPNNAAAGFRKYQQSWPWADVPRHLHFFTKWSLHELLGQCGFVVEQTLHVGYCRQFQPDWILSQQQISELLGESRSMHALESWLFLARTAFSRRDYKYDSLRVHAKVA